MTDQNNTSVVSNVQYGAANEVTQITINGGVETRQYNSLHQLTNITGLGQNVTYTFPVGSNNGKISSQTDAISGETVNYQYDSLNRLISAAGSGWSQGFGYDDFGNLTSRTGTNAINTPADPNTNRLTQYAYDANGNMTSTGNGYDVENRLIAVNSGTTQYFYDAQNKRVWTGNFSSPYASATLVSESFAVYGADGKLLGQYSPQFGYDSQGHLISMSFSGGPSRTYFGNRLLTNPQDRLGSIGKYYPYGEERNYPALPNDQVKFATYTRDGVSGLDYADQRYYSSTVGRFMSPDPYQASTCAQGCACSAQRSPGVWNRYTYVTGDPVGFNDPRGLFVQDPDDSNSVNFEFSFYPPELLAALAQNSTPVDSLKLWEVTLGLIVPDASGNFAAFSASTANFGNISYYIEQSPGQFLDLIEQSLQPTPTGTKTLWDVLARAVSAGNPMAVVVTAVLTLLAQPAGGKDEICFEQYEQDSAICRQLHSSACWDQAAQRLGACLAGRPIPPFPYGK